MAGLGRYYVFDLTVRGEPAPGTGYLENIKTLDAAVRQTVVPLVRETIERAPQTPPELLLPECLKRLEAELPCPIEGLCWWLTPTYCVEMLMPATGSVLLRQRFDFAAAHRLHVPSLSDEENRATFGRCNNPSGHGHNYQVEPVVEAELDDAGAALDLAAIESLTMEHVIDPFDHTHLNADTAEFATEGGLNPSVEHIAAVFFERLAPQIEAASSGRARLRSMTVWETDRTSATYPG